MKQGRKQREMKKGQRREEEQDHQLVYEGRKEAKHIKTTAMISYKYNIERETNLLRALMGRWMGAGSNYMECEAGPPLPIAMEAVSSKSLSIPAAESNPSLQEKKPSAPCETRTELKKCVSLRKESSESLAAFKEWGY